MQARATVNRKPPLRRPVPDVIASLLDCPGQHEHIAGWVCEVGRLITPRTRRKRAQFTRARCLQPPNRWVEILCIEIEFCWSQFAFRGLHGNSSGVSTKAFTFVDAEPLAARDDELRIDGGLDRQRPSKSGLVEVDAFPEALDREDRENMPDILSHAQECRPECRAEQVELVAADRFSRGVTRGQRSRNMAAMRAGIDAPKPAKNIDWNVVASYYDAYVRTDLDWSFFLKHAQASGGSAVLELMCGTGRITMPLVE